LDPLPLFAGELLASLHWLARYTHTPLGEVFAAALPGPLRHGEPLPDTHGWAWRLTEAGRTGLAGMRAGRPRLLALRLQGGAVDEELLDTDIADTGDTVLDAGSWRGAARTLAQRELAERIAVPASQAAPVPRPGPQLNPEQQIAVDAIFAALDGFAPHLPDGVTGIAHTEVSLPTIPVST